MDLVSAIDGQRLESPGQCKFSDNALTYFTASVFLGGGDSPHFLWGPL